MSESRTLSSHYWSELRTVDFAHLDCATLVAVLPLAATEQHGPHLPLSVDTDIVNGIVRAAVGLLEPQERVLFLPTQCVGKSNEHEAFAGTLSLSAQTAIAGWMEIGASLARTGIRKLLLFNGHGGQVSLLDIVARDLRVAHGMLTLYTSWDRLVQTQARELFGAQELRFGIHGGDMETSLMLALRPDLVDMAQARHFCSTAQQRAQRYAIVGNGVSAKLGWMMQDYNAQGAAGNAAAATREKGHALLGAAAEALVGMLREFSTLDGPLDSPV